MSDDPPSQSNTPSDPSPSSDSRNPSFWAELKRRKVMRVAITYGVVAWLLIQIAATVFPQLGMPDWAPRMVTLLLLIGFPIALIIAWAFELTPDGIKTTKAADEGRDDAPVSKKQQSKRNWLAFGFAAGLPTLIFGVLAGVFYIKARTAEAEIAASKQEQYDKSIAVLPLDNMSPDKENAFFADGVQEDILTNLSKVDELRVISRTSTQQYRETVKTMKQISGELGVRYLVEGSVRRAGDQVLVTVQLIDTNVEQHVWAESYNRKLDDIFAIQAAIAKEIAGQLHAALSPEEIERIEARPTKNQEAYDAYIKFRNLITEASGGVTESMEPKLALLEEAVSHDPEFAEAWARLAIESIFFWDRTDRKNPALYKRAYEALERAKQFGPDLPDIPYALSSFAFREHRDPEASIRYLLQTVSMDPAFPLINYRLGSRYLTLGRITESKHYYEAALSNNPLIHAPNIFLARAYMLLGQWDDAFALLEKNANRTSEEIWFSSLRYARYLQTGKVEDYAEAIKTEHHFAEEVLPRVQVALINRDYAQALALLEHVDPKEGFSFRGFLGTYLYSSSLARALVQQAHDPGSHSANLVTRAKERLKAVIQENAMSSPNYWSELAICEALSSNKDAMMSYVRIARNKSDSSYYRYTYAARVEVHIAIAHIALGEHDKAIETLEAASKMDGPIFLNRELELWFVFDVLKGNPRFEALLEG